MKIFKKNKWLFWLLFLTVGLILLIMTLLYVKKNIFYNNKSIYGDRLEGIELATISHDLKTDIRNSLLLNEDVKEASVDVRGKIVNVLIEVKEGIATEKAIKLADNLLMKFNEEQTNFYDMQFFITWNHELTDEVLPLIGYKNKYSETIVWNKIK